MELYVAIKKHDYINDVTLLRSAKSLVSGLQSKTLFLWYELQTKAVLLDLSYTKVYFEDKDETGDILIF